MISNGTYLMILGIFLVLIVIFLLVLFFYLRRTVRCSKPFGRMTSGSVNGEEKRRIEAENGRGPGSSSSDTIQNKNFESHFEQVSHLSHGLLLLFFWILVLVC
jgi:hypothetical protein